MNFFVTKVSPNLELCIRKKTMGFTRKKKGDDESMKELVMLRRRVVNFYTRSWLIPLLTKMKYALAAYL